MIQPEQMSDREVVARTLWGEARSQGAEGMTAVACVIQNRAKTPCWWGRDPRSVCLAAQQFSAWNSSDAQARMMRAENIHDTSIEVARRIATEIDLGTLHDITNGADHYCTAAVADKTKWARGRSPVAQFGSGPNRHLFFRLGPYA